MGIPCAHILKQRILENQGLLLNNLSTHWHFYRAWTSRDAEINNPVWENWPENIPRRDDFHYVDLETTPVLRPLIARAPLEANSSLPTNTRRPISPYQLDDVPEADTPQIISDLELEPASAPLSSLALLSTPLSVCSRIIWPKQDTSHADYNHEYQSEIDPFLEFKSPSQIKTKGRGDGNRLSCLKKRSLRPRMSQRSR